MVCLKSEINYGETKLVIGGHRQDVNTDKETINYTERFRVKTELSGLLYLVIGRGNIS